MEEEKTLAAMALIEFFQAFARDLEQPAVVFTRKRELNRCSRRTG